MFAYFYWHARHMFLVPSVLRCSFVIVGDTYVVYWFGGCCLFVGSSVAGCFCLAQVYDFGALGLQLGMFVLSHWFGACCFLLFTSALQGWGPAPTVGAFFLLLLLLLFFGRFTVFRPCTHEWTCGCVICRVW
jgi:hypothetical protein